VRNAGAGFNPGDRCDGQELADRRRRSAAAPVAPMWADLSD